MEKTPVSIIIDDPAPLVHVYREHHPGNRCNELGEPLKKTIPLDFMKQFCEITEETGIRGKFSIIPMPGCLGDIVHGLKGYDQREVEAWLDLAKTRLSPAFDFCPEILTHHNAIDLKTGAPLPENEEKWSFHQTRATLAPYIGRALSLLREAGIEATGVTSPWYFGIEVEADYAAAISDAFFDVLGKKDCWYFLHNRTEEQKVRPLVAFRENGRRVVSVAATCQDAFWRSIDSDRTDDAWVRELADGVLTEDGSAGMLPDALKRGNLPVLITHWQSLFSNGRRTGLKALRETAGRMSRCYGESLVWTNFSELMQRAFREERS